MVVFILLDRQRGMHKKSIDKISYNLPLFDIVQLTGNMGI